LLVGKDAETHELIGEIGGFGLRVGARDAQKYQESCTNLPGDLAAHFDPGLLHALNQ
jgi:hypothetical protein